MDNYVRLVQYYETDKMGIVHHSNYIRWFEEARIFCMEKLGFSYKEMEDRGVMLPVTEVSSKYKSSTKYGDKVKIEVRVEKISSAILEFSYVIKDFTSEEVRVLGSSKHCFVDLDFKLVNIKKIMPDFYEKCRNSYN